jgi:hypothetical protein
MGRLAVVARVGGHVGRIHAVGGVRPLARDDPDTFEIAVCWLLAS